MTFEAALSLMKEGKKLYRPSYKPGYYYTVVRRTMPTGGELSDIIGFCSDGDVWHNLIQGYEMLAEDWEVMHGESV